MSTTTHTIAIAPHDTLFFRNGAPFSMGEETWAETSLLPHPSVIWGALFTSLMSEGLLDLSQKEALILRDIFLYRPATKILGEKMLLPAPLDLFYREKKPGNYEVFEENYEERTAFLSNAVSELLYLTIPKTQGKNIKVDRVENFWIDTVDFLENYPARNASIRLYAPSEFVLPYSKIGIGRSNESRTSEEGMLYRTDMSELSPDWRIGVVLDGPADMPDQGLFRLGGEGKTAVWHKLDKAFPHNPPPNQDDIWFKLYFQTPALFNSGGNGVQELSKLHSANLKSASIGKPLHIGGWDMEERRPKPMRRAAPPGSVYVFKGNPYKTSLEINPLFDKNDLQKGFCRHHFIQF